MRPPAALAMAAGAPRRSATAEDLKKSGRVEIKQTRIAFIGGGNLGGGKLYFGGKAYDAYDSARIWRRSRDSGQRSNR